MNQSMASRESQSSNSGHDGRAGNSSRRTASPFRGLQKPPVFGGASPRKSSGLGRGGRKGRAGAGATRSAKRESRQPAHWSRSVQSRARCSSRSITGWVPPSRGDERPSRSLLPAKSATVKTGNLVVWVRGTGLGHLGLRDLGSGRGAGPGVGAKTGMGLVERLGVSDFVPDEQGHRLVHWRRDPHLLAAFAAGRPPSHLLNYPPVIPAEIVARPRTCAVVDLPFATYSRP